MDDVSLQQLHEQRQKLLAQLEKVEGDLSDGEVLDSDQELCPSAADDSSKKAKCASIPAYGSLSHEILKSQERKLNSLIAQNTRRISAATGSSRVPTGCTPAPPQCSPEKPPPPPPVPPAKRSPPKNGSNKVAYPSAGKLSAPKMTNGDVGGSDSDSFEDIDAFLSQSRRKRPLAEVTAHEGPPTTNGILPGGAGPSGPEKRQKTLSESSGEASSSGDEPALTIHDQPSTSGAVGATSKGDFGGENGAVDPDLSEPEEESGESEMDEGNDLDDDFEEVDELEDEDDDDQEEDFDLKMCDAVLEKGSGGSANSSFEAGLKGIDLSESPVRPKPGLPPSRQSTDPGETGVPELGKELEPISDADSGHDDLGDDAENPDLTLEQSQIPSGDLRSDEPEPRFDAEGYRIYEPRSPDGEICEEVVAREKSGAEEVLDGRENGGDVDGEPEYFYDSSDVEDFGEAEIDELLEGPVHDQKEAALFGNLKERPITREKTVLKYRSKENFELLPHGWVEVTHSSGIPVYLHKASRVCTFGRPYFLGPGSVRHHEVPLSAIPCLYQRQVQEWEKEYDREQRKRNLNQVVAGLAKKCPVENGGEGTKNGENSAENGPSLQVAENPGPSSDAHPSTENAEENAKNLAQRLPEVKVATLADISRRNLTPLKLRDYCTKAFEFETVVVKRFRNWSDHRTFHKEQRRRQKRPTLPANVKLIKIPATDKNMKPQKKDVTLNPHGKTSVSLLHEYVQRVMHCSPEYDFGQTTSASEPYSATVIIQGLRYATGYGNNKKNAKLDAAQRTISVLIPNMDFNSNATVKLPNEADVLELFDLFTVTDSRVFELSIKAGQPPPFQILNECLRRNAAFGDTKCHTEIAHKRHQQHEFTMSVGKNQVKVACSNKKEGKQKASQAMLEKLHPHIKTWGSLIRLYGYGTASSGKRGQKGGVAKDAAGDKKGGGPSQAGEGAPAPNKAILEKLRREMLKLHEEAEKGDQREAKARDNALVAEAVRNLSL